MLKEIKKAVQYILNSFVKKITFHFEIHMK